MMQSWSASLRVLAVPPALPVPDVSVVDVVADVSVAETLVEDALPVSVVFVSFFAQPNAASAIAMEIRNRLFISSSNSFLQRRSFCTKQSTFTRVVAALQ
jgi:hypothetical protein